MHELGMLKINLFTAVHIAIKYFPFEVEIGLSVSHTGIFISRCLPCKLLVENKGLFHHPYN